MPTRIVTGDFLGPDGTPLSGFRIQFTVAPTAYTTTAHYPALTTETVTDPDGNMAVTLVTNITYKVGLVGAYQHTGTVVGYPEGSQFSIVVPDGEGPISLENVRGLSGINPDAPDVQAMILAVVADYLADNGGQGPHTHAMTDVVGLGTALAGKADTAHDHAGTYVTPASLAVVATTGAYSDLTGKPTLFDGNYASLTNKPTLGTAAAMASTAFATSAQGTKADTAVQPAALTTALAGKADTGHNHDAAYAALSHTHTIANVTALQAALDSKAATSHDHAATYAALVHTHAYADITGKPSTFAPSAHTHDDRYYTEAEVDAMIAGAGAGSFPGYGGDGSAVTVSRSDHTHAGYALTSSLAGVATSGAYADLTGKPTIPTTLVGLDTTVTGAQLNALKTKVDGIAAGATANSSDATLLNRTNHTGTQSADTITDGTTNKAYTAAEKTKLAGIATGAEVNVQADWNAVSGDAFIANKPTLGTAAAMASTAFATAAQGSKADTAVQPAGIANFETTTQLNTRDTNNRARANHTGEQAISTVTGLQTAIDGKAASTHTHVATTDLTATGTKSSATYLRGDNTWATPTNTTYTEITSAEITAGTASTARTISGRRSEEIVTKARTGMAATAHTHAIADTTGLQTALDGKAATSHNHDAAYAAIGHDHAGVYATAAHNHDAAYTPIAHASSTANPHSVTKAQVGLANVDNTSDANKPVSTATATALSGKAATTHTHAIADTTGLQTAIDGKAATTHTHTAAGVVTVALHGGGEAIAVGMEAIIEMPFAGTWTGWRIFSKQSGSIVTDVQKDTYANYPPTSGDSIAASAKPTLSSAVKNQNTTLTGWTTAFSAGDVVRVVVDSATTVEDVSVSLLYNRTI